MSSIFFSSLPRSELGEEFVSLTSKNSSFGNDSPRYLCYSLSTRSLVERLSNASDSNKDGMMLKRLWTFLINSSFSRTLNAKFSIWWSFLQIYAWWLISYAISISLISNIFSHIDFMQEWFWSPSLKKFRQWIHLFVFGHSFKCASSSFLKWV